MRPEVSDEIRSRRVTVESEVGAVLRRARTGRVWAETNGDLAVLIH